MQNRLRGKNQAIGCSYYLQSALNAVSTDLFFPSKTRLNDFANFLMIMLQMQIAGGISGSSGVLVCFANSITQSDRTAEIPLAVYHESQSTATSQQSQLTMAPKPMKGSRSSRYCLDHSFHCQVWVFCSSPKERLSFLKLSIYSSDFRPVRHTGVLQMVFRCAMRVWLRP